MKITDLRIELYQKEQPPAKFQANLPPRNRASRTIVRVMTDEGIEGTAFAGFFARGIDEATITSLKAEVVG